MSQEDKQHIRMLELKLTEGPQNDLYFRLPLGPRFNGTIEKVFAYIQELMKEER